MNESMNESAAQPETEKTDALKDENSGFKFCTRCGRRLAADAAYCDGCGHMQGAKTSPPLEGAYRPKKTYRPEKISDIIGKERKYYNDKFAIINETGSASCWNWYACLGWNWFAYRKMPVEAIACFALFMLFGKLGAVGLLLRAALLAVCGVFGNYIYLKHIERVIDRIEAYPVNMREAAVKEYGGVSGVALVAAVVLSAMFFGGMALWKTLSRLYFNPLWYLKKIF